MKLVKDSNTQEDIKKISDKDAEDAFKTILTWMGEDPNREGLLETPKRVVKAFKEYFKGYKENPNEILDKTLVMLKVTMIWLCKKIFQYKAIANITWHLLLVKHM